MTDDPLLKYITAARWFGGKGRSPQLIGVTALPWLRPPGDWPAIRQEIVEVGYPGGDDHEFYQLVVNYRPTDQVTDPVITATTDPVHGELSGVDGTEDPAAHGALLDLLLSTRAGDASDTGTLVAHRLGDDPLVPGLPSRVFGGEQSNTSVLFAHLAIMKLFRRIEVGRNLDIETHDVLTRSGNADVARLYGWIEGSWSAPDQGIGYGADLAMVTELLPEARDGWEFALAELRAGHDFSAQAHRLGAALANVHDALRANFLTATEDGDQVSSIMGRRLDAAVAAAPQLAPYSDGLRGVFRSLAGRQLQTQRVHGDFHLGQTLFTPSGWKIIDFEGEPAKTLAERSRPDSIWRDIAGALRSFDYAAAHHPAAAGDTLAADWARVCQEAFLSGYGVSAGRDDHDVGDDHGDHGELDVLRAYVADKAIYEVVYEARNRPDWVQIPLTAVASIARRSQHVD
ncbi:phosphotransferase [Microlunatus sp. Gsoil 973]|uniref:maltokinase N-terminal cap-like domain-containing protein n=1 Tax=Microlunatus sp. Gsoil 973 TaxID=2672569 RepID=UPI0012B4E3CC|nr:phosphotransferase [Microlunatus sp. Gsoil 973]QGN32347.1 phosphotransferase [Microlunatus sp. Gsoil 973]